MLNLFKKKKTVDQTEQETAQSIQAQNNLKKPTNKRLIIAIIALSLSIIAALVVFFSCFYIKKEYKSVENFLTLPYPNQTESSGQFTKNVDDYTITYTIKANYTIYGKVVEKQYYFPNKIINKICRYDFGLVFDKLLNNNYTKHIKFRNNKNRFLQYGYPTSLINELGSKSAIIDSISNNHVIHSNDSILKCFRNVREGDYIKLEGFLVDVYYQGQNLKGSWPTSLSRTDHGDGACEIIYVTNITWLKEK